MASQQRIRRFSAWAAVAAVSLGAAACGSDALEAKNKAPKVVATVDGTDISGAEFVEVLNAYSKNRRFVDAEYIKDGVVNSTGRATLLTNLIRQQVYENKFAELKLKITEKDRKRAKEDVIAALRSTETFEGFSKEFQKRLVEEYAVREAVHRSIGRGESEPSDEALKQYYQDNIEDFPAATPSITVAELQQRLAAGEDFSALASQYSNDPGSKVRGGDLSVVEGESVKCSDPEEFVPEFRDAIKSLPLNVVSDPVKTQFGYHFILVTGTQEPGGGKPTLYCTKHILLPETAIGTIDPFTQVKDQVRTEYFNQPFKELFGSAKITISEKEGVLDNTQGTLMVIPTSTTTSTTTTTSTSGVGGTSGSGASSSAVIDSSGSASAPVPPSSNG